MSDSLIFQLSDAIAAYVSEHEKLKVKYEQSIAKLVALQESKDDFEKLKVEYAQTIEKLADLQSKNDAQRVSIEKLERSLLSLKVEAANLTKNSCGSVTVGNSELACRDNLIEKLNHEIEDLRVTISRRDELLNAKSIELGLAKGEIQHLKKAAARSVAPAIKISENILGCIGHKAYAILQAALKIKGVYLTGSLLLQAYIGEVWDNFDIDLIACDKKTVFDFFMINGFSVSIVAYGNYSKVSHVYRATDSTNTIKFDILVPFKNIGMPRKTREECYNLALYVVSQFDFDFCKMLYDGCNAHIINRNAVDGKVHHRKPVSHGNIVTSQERIQKYIARGFGFVEDDLDQKIDIHNNLFVTQLAKN
jgi:hypothetical protein